MSPKGEAWVFSRLPILGASLRGDSRKNVCLGIRQTSVRIPALLPNSCVALGKSLSLSEPQLSVCKMRQTAVCLSLICKMYCVPHRIFMESTRANVSEST